MAEFTPIIPFGIDHGELDDQSRQECFALGYELCQIVGLLRRPDAFERPVHADNRKRIEEVCRIHNRAYELLWMADDASETWMWLAVAPT